MERIRKIFILLVVTALFPWATGGSSSGSPAAAPTMPLSAPSSSSIVPDTTELANDVVLFDSNRVVGPDEERSYEIFRMHTDGGDVRQLTSAHDHDSWWPKISPDRTKIMFVRTPRGTHDRDYTQVSTWVMDADGSDLHEILPLGVYGWEIQGHPEWSPDGTKVVTMCGPSSNVQVCVVDADGSNPRRVTNKAASTQIDPFENEGRRGGTNVDPSWSPDGEHLLFVGCPVFTCTNDLYEIYRIRVDGTEEERLTFNTYRDHDPYYSPNGEAIAFLRQTGTPLQWGIFAIDPDGENERTVIDDGGINSKPGWSSDSQWIFFHRWPVGRTLFNVFKIRPDGTELTELEPRPAVGFGEYDNEFPVNSPF